MRTTTGFMEIPKNITESAKIMKKIGLCLQIRNRLRLEGSIIQEILQRMTKKSIITTDAQGKIMKRSMIIIEDPRNQYMKD